MKEINCKIKVRCWKDKGTGSWIIYSKEYDISGYGETKAKARKMFDVVVKSILLDTRPADVRVRGLRTDPR